MCSCHCYEVPRRSVCLDELVDVSRRRAVDSGERIGHRSVDVEEADSPVEERLHRSLVRSVERARKRPAAPAGFTREREERKRVEVGLVELQAKTAGEVQLLQRRRL